MAMKPNVPILVQRHRPGKQEGDLQIEHDEQDGDQIVAHVESHARIFEWLETAFVRRQLLARRLDGGRASAAEQ